MLAMRDGPYIERRWQPLVTDQAGKNLATAIATRSMVSFDNDPDVGLAETFRRAALTRGAHFHPRHNMFLGAPEKSTSVAPWPPYGSCSAGHPIAWATHSRQ
jgi:hypothetical protein